MIDPESVVPDDALAVAARDKLRAGILLSGLADDVPLAQIESLITRDGLAKTVGAQQKLLLDTVRSLVVDGLVEFDGWDDLPPSDALTRVHDLFVNNYDDPGAWAFAVWLKLTEAGTRIANQLQDQSPQ